MNILLQSRRTFTVRVKLKIGIVRIKNSGVFPKLEGFGMAIIMVIQWKDPVYKTKIRRVSVIVSQLECMWTVMFAARRGMCNI